MQATDIMTTNNVTVRPDTEVREIVDLLLAHKISAVPVTDANNHVLGIVSEGDLIRRVEDDDGDRHNWSLEAIFSTRDKVREYTKTHGRKADDIMTRKVVSITKETPLHQIARIFAKHHLDRVPVIHEGKLAGIVSRADVLLKLAEKVTASVDVVASDDETIRETIKSELAHEVGLNMGVINVVVENGAVELWGVVSSAAKKKAAQIAAENAPGVKSVKNRLAEIPSRMWAA